MDFVGGNAPTRALKNVGGLSNGLRKGFRAAIENLAIGHFPPDAVFPEVQVESAFKALSGK